MAVVQALHSLPHLASGNPLQLSAQRISAPAGNFCCFSSRPCSGLLLSWSHRSWSSSRGRCKRNLVVNVRLSKSQCEARGQSECSNVDASSAEDKEFSVAKRGFNASTALPRNFVQGFTLQAAAAVAAGVLLWGGSNALAADPLRTCACLLKECRVELAKCIADPSCAANVACLQSCNDRPNETECQIGCGDLFENKVVDQFNECAVTRKGCVPQKQDEGRFPVPSPAVLVPEFDMTRFSGTWYITSGLNKTFDTFDCQKHEFSAESNQVTGKLSWRITTPDGGFFTRSAVQRFVQDDKQPGVLLNHGNEFLHYEDDWYILASKIENKSDDYVFIYYRGKNDAWDGYGGAVVYTKSPKLPKSIIPELQDAAKKVNLDFNKFTTTNNTCGPEPPLIARLETTVEKGEEFVENEVQEGEKFFEETVEEGENLFVAFTKRLGQAQEALFARLGLAAEQVELDEERFFQELGDEEKQLLKDLQMDASDVGKLFSKTLPLRKLR